MSRAISYMTHHKFFADLVMQMDRRLRNGEASPTLESTMHHAKATELRAKFYTWRQLLRKAYDGGSHTLKPQDAIILDFSFKISVKILPEELGTPLEASEFRRIQFNHDDGTALLMQFGVTPEELRSLREERLQSEVGLFGNKSPEEMLPAGRAAIDYMKQGERARETEVTLEQMYGLHKSKNKG